MDLERMKRPIAAAWILAAGVIGFAANVSSVPALIVAAVLGFGPPVVMLLLWRQPSQTMTESIQQARL
jgi:multisubunit Na+/H+ antiporter MnhC subunit